MSAQPTVRVRAIRTAAYSRARRRPRTTKAVRMSPAPVRLERALPGRGRLPAAVLWDMDGTLVDTEPYWITAEHAIVEEAGGRLERRVRARSSSATTSWCPAEFIRDHSAASTLDPLEIVEELLDARHRAGPRARAVATGRASSCSPRCATQGCRTRW